MIEEPETTDLKVIYLVAPCKECIEHGNCTWCEDSICCDGCGKAAIKFERVVD